MRDPVIRIAVTDLKSGETETAEVPAGTYVVTTTEPCHVAGVQTYPTKGTVVITLKDVKS